jgi:DNA modification methylase
MLFFRKDGENLEPVSHAAPTDEKTALKIAKENLEYMHRQGLVGYIPQDDILAELIEYAKFDVYDWQKIASPVWMDIQQGNVLNRMKGVGDERHVCPLQLDTISRCLKLYTKPGDVVMDPFNGIGSTGYEAIKMRRKYLGFELKPEYAALANVNMQEAEQSSSNMFEITE